MQLKKIVLYSCRISPRIARIDTTPLLWRVGQAAQCGDLITHRSALGVMNRACAIIFYEGVKQ